METRSTSLISISRKDLDHIVGPRAKIAVCRRVDHAQYLAEIDLNRDLEFD